DDRFQTWSITLTGGESDLSRLGRLAHSKWRPPAGFRKEFTLPSGKRVDAINFETREIIELKPNNAKAIAKGQVQLRQYIAEAEREFGGKWTGYIQTYARGPGP
ncbi:MAG TPA: hypothetical protein VEJ89_11310, partial [Myxococcaceae bacterium]|nr:hypothetical protein [Myxococcaceae bacterium]